LDTLAKSSPRPRYSATAWALTLLAAVLVGVVAYKAARIVPRAAALYSRARELKPLVTDPAALLHPDRLPWLRERLGATRDDMQAIRDEVGFLFPLVERLDWIPGVGPDLAAAPALLDVGIALCDVGWWSLLGVEPVWAAIHRADGKDGPGSLELATPVLASVEPRFEAASAILGGARSALNRLQRIEHSPRLAPYVAQLNAYWPVLEGGLLLAQDLPEMLGHDKPVSYLLIAQNNQELRPTGGFISGAGLLKISAGRIISSTFQDSYAVDALCDFGVFPAAPRPLREYIWAPALMFRDANWSPDLSASGATLSSLYRRCQGEGVDGIVTLDIDAVTALLWAMGPLQPEGYPTPVSGATLIEYMNEYWTNPLRTVDITDQQKGEWWLHRKDFMADLLKAALGRLTGEPASLELVPLGKAVLGALQERHIQVAMSGAALGRGWLASAWNGGLRTFAGDYLMVVDANVGFRKVNSLVQQSLDYRVDVSNMESPRATLTLRYAHRGTGLVECVAGSRYDDSYNDLVSGCLWDYVRVYAPAGSRLVHVSGADSETVVSAESGKAVFGCLWVIAPGQTRELVFEYELPPLSQLIPGQATGPYRLLVQKQPGTASVPLTVQVLSDGWKFRPSRSTRVSFYGNDQVDASLASDVVLMWADGGAAARRANLATVLVLGVGVALVVIGCVLRRSVG